MCLREWRLVSRMLRSKAMSRFARRRKEPTNRNIELGDGIVVTEAVERRIRKRADAQIPKGMADRVSALGGYISYLPFWISAYFVGQALAGSFTDGALWLIMIAWVGVIPTGVMFALDWIVGKPIAARQARVTARVKELGKQREADIEERKVFYSSPEWKLVRRQVIEEEGNTCNDCGRYIRVESDITVDHKNPRSKHPGLSLERSNLRVVCRSCNSRKGADDWFED